MSTSKSLKRQVFFVITASLTMVAVFPQTSYAQDGSISFSLKPISASGFHTIAGNKITLPQGGQRVWFEVYYSQWSPELLLAASFRIDSTGYSNATGAPLQLPVIPCTTDTECETELGAGSTCALENQPPNITGLNTCRAGFRTAGRDDDIPKENGGPFAVAAVNTIRLNFDYGVAHIADPAKSDPGFDIYMGTLVLDIPEDAAGTYTINFLPSPDSLAIVVSENDMLLFPTSAVIELPVSCCLPEGSCQSLPPSTCVNSGGTIIGQSCGGDCNQNGVNDSCDFEIDFNADCNDNGLPDICEGGGSISGDCNDNGTLDTCDIESGSSFDVDGNCVPDECDPFAAPQGEMIPVPKNRYVSFTPSNVGCNSAIRVKLTSLYHPNPKDTPRPDISSFEGEYRWVGPASSYQESEGISDILFTAAETQCDPYFANWSTINMLHVFGDAILPSSSYEIQMVDQSCADLNDSNCYSDPLIVTTGKWGDVSAPFAQNAPSQPNISDVLAIVDKWLGFMNPLLVHAQLQPNIPDPSFNVGIREILLTQDAWLGTLYSFDGPQTCSP